MKVVINESFELEDGDIKLLKVPLPDNPCSICSASRDGSCCGCPEEREYRRKIIPYEERGIYDIALKLRTLSNLNDEIVRLSHKHGQIYSSLPVEVQQKLVHIGGRKR